MASEENPEVGATNESNEERHGHPSIPPGETAESLMRRAMETSSLGLHFYRFGEDGETVDLQDFENIGDWQADKRPTMVHCSKEDCQHALAAVQSDDHPWRRHLREYSHIWAEYKEGSPHNPMAEMLKNNASKFHVYFGKTFFCPDFSRLCGGIGITRMAENAQLLNGAGVFQLLHMTKSAEIPYGWRVGDPPPTMSNGREMTEIQFSGCFQHLITLVRAKPKKRGYEYQLSSTGLAYGFIQSTQQFFEIARPHIIMDHREFKARCCFNLSYEQTKFNPVELWASQPMTTKVKAPGFRPDAPKFYRDKDGNKILNLFRPSLVKPNNGSVDKFFEFLDLWNLDEHALSRLIYWMVNMVRFKRPRYSLMIISPQQGVGKDTLGEFMMHLVGEHNSTLIGEIDIEQGNLQSAAYKSLGVVSEVYRGNNPKFMANLKAILVNDQVKLAEKFEKSIIVENFLSGMLFSNDLRAAKLEAGDRRFDVFILRNCTLPPEEFWVDLRKWFYLQGGAGAVLNYLQNVNLEEPRFRGLSLNTAPNSSDKQRFLAEQQPDWVDDLKDGIGDAVALSFADAHLSVGTDDVSVSDLRHWLGQLGFTRAHGAGKLTVATIGDSGKHGRLKMTVWSKGLDVKAPDVRNLIKDGKFAVLADDTGKKLADFGLSQRIEGSDENRVVELRPSVEGSPRDV